MSQPETPSANSSPRPAQRSMTGKTVEEYEATRISGPLSKQEFLAYLRKIGKLPPGAEWQIKSEVNPQ